MHDGRAINGISHEAYSAEIKKQFESLFGTNRTIASMTKEEAQAFLKHVQELPNTTIVDFNKGVAAEAYAAEEAGEEAYRAAGGKPGIGKDAQDRAYRQGVEAANEAVHNHRIVAERRLAEAAAEGAGFLRRIGRRVLALLPFLSAGTVLVTTGDVQAAGREAMLELTGTDTARDLGLVAAEVIAEAERERDQFADDIRAEWRKPGNTFLAPRPIME